MMMMTVADSTANTMPQPIEYNSTYAVPSYDYRSHHSWHKPSYAMIHPSPLFPTHPTGGPSMDMANKAYYPSFGSIPNLNNTNPNFYRRHTESALSSAYTPSSSSTPFNYSHHSPGLYFGWNHGSSLMRTHSASYQDYSGSTSSFTSYNPMNPSPSSQPLTQTKPPTGSQVQQTASNSTYSPFSYVLPHPVSFNYPPPPPSNSSTVDRTSKRSLPSKISKRPRLTAHLRSEILKLKAAKPTVFVWEIQQNLLLNGICTAQTLPSTMVIQRVLSESFKPPAPLPTTKASPVTICLSPSPSPALSDGASMSECSICLESYRSGQEVSILACSHEYHSSCIGEWMQKNRSCPMCRKDIRNQPQFVTLLI